MKIKRLRIVNKFRFTTFLLFVCLVITAFLNILLKTDAAYSSYVERTYTEFKVMSGDTLWEIARNNNPHGQDVRKVVHEIMEINNMQSADIRPGYIIKIPSK